MINHWPYFPQKFKVYTEVLAENGYHVGSTGKKWAPGIAVNADGEPRHLAGQPYDWGYPIRGIIRGDMLYIHNFEPTRWLAGNPETGYLNIDGSPTKTFILDNQSITCGFACKTMAGINS